MNTQEEIAELKAATREAHEAIQGLREVMRDLRKLQSELPTEAERQVDKFIDPIIKERIEALGEVTDIAIKEADERINKRFDTLADIMTGEDKASRRKGNRSLAELAKEKKAHDKYKSW